MENSPSLRVPSAQAFTREQGSRDIARTSHCSVERALRSHSEPLPHLTGNRRPPADRRIRPRHRKQVANPTNLPQVLHHFAEWKHLVEVIDVIQDVPREVCGERVDILAALSERDWVKLKEDRWGSELASRWAAPRKTAGSLPSASILTRLGRLPTSAQNVSRGIASAHVNRWSARRFGRGVTCASREFLSGQLNCTRPEESSTAAGIGLTHAVRPSRETEYASFAKVSGTGSNA